MDLKLENVKDYKIEDLKYLEMDKNNQFIGVSSNRFRNGEKIYFIENKLSIDEKLAILDQFTENRASYIIDLVKKYEDSLKKGELKLDSYGRVKANSFNAWKTKNDTRGIITIFDQEYYFFYTKRRFNERSLIVSDQYDLDFYKKANIIHQWYHDLLSTLVKEEDKYFRGIDTSNIKVTELENLMEEHFLDDLIGYENRKSVWKDFYIIGTNTRDCKLENIELTEQVLDIYKDFDREIKELRKQAEMKINEIARNLEDKNEI